MTLPKETEIRSAIVKLDQAQFQALAQELITRFYGYDNPTYRGTAAHTAATAPGSPDVYWILPEGKYAYLECGHFPEKGKAVEKIREDIARCQRIEKEELGLGKVTRIAIAYSCMRLSSGDVDALRGIDDRVDLFGVDRMAELLMTTGYHDLADTYLGIPIGSGQLMSPDEFEQKNSCRRFSAPLDVELFGRDEALDELVEMMASNRLVVLSGLPGVGKTKLALEAIRRYATDNDAMPLVMTSNGLSWWADLSSSISANRQTVLLVDDGNELSELDALFDFVSDHDNLHVMMTLRNYATTYVMDKAKVRLDVKRVDLGPLDDHVISDFLCAKADMGRGVAIRIAGIVRGNMRLAVTASNAAKKDVNRAFSDMPELVEACYCHQIAELSRDQKDADCVVCILGRHEMQGNANLDSLLEHFGLTHRQYRDACTQLHQEELVDVCQDYKAVGPGDQVLRDYLLYKALCVDGAIRLVDIMGLTGGRSLCTRIVSEVYNSFPGDGTWRKLQEQIEELWGCATDEQKWLLAEDYTFLIESRCLGLVACEIDDIGSGHVDYLTNPGISTRISGGCSARHLDLLSNLLHRGEFGDADELFFYALSKNNTFADDYRFCLCRRMCFSESSHRTRFAYETQVLDKLFDLWCEEHDSTYGVLLMDYVAELLKPDFDGPATLEGDKAVFAYGRLGYSDDLLTLRRHAFCCLYSVRKDKRFRDRADSIVVGIKRGRPGESALKLWVATQRVLDEEYLSKIESVSDQLVPSFAQLEFILRYGGYAGVADDLRFLHADAAIDLVSLFSTYNLDSRQEGEEGVRLRVRRHGTDEFIAAFGIVAGIPKLSSYNVRKVMECLSEEQLKDISMRAPEVILSGISPGCLSDNLVATMFSLQEPGELRMVAGTLDDEHLRAEWLQVVDSWRLHHSCDAGVSRDVLAGAVEVGEVVPFQDAMRLESLTSGFFASYIDTVLSRLGPGDSRLRLLVPYRVDDEKRAFCVETGHLPYIESALLALASDSLGFWSPELLRVVLRADSTFTGRVAPTLVNHDGQDDCRLEAFGEALWGLDDAHGLATRFWEALRLADGRDGNIRIPYTLQAFVASGLPEHEDVVVNWLASVSVEDGALVRGPVSVGMELEENVRLRYILALCDAGLSVDGFTELPFLMTVPFGLSWSGSLIPTLQNKVHFLEELKERLKGVPYIRYREVLDEKIAELRDRCKETELKEFLEEL